MKQYLVIGLGRFGTSVAKTLYEAGENILGIDVSEELVQDRINNNILKNEREWEFYVKSKRWSCKWAIRCSAFRN